MSSSASSSSFWAYRRGITQAIHHIHNSFKSFQASGIEIITDVWCMVLHKVHFLDQLIPLYSLLLSYSFACCIIDLEKINLKAILAGLDISVIHMFATQNDLKP